MPWEAAPVFPWWGYGLAIAGGIGFGYLQIWLLRKSLQGEGPLKWLIAVKFFLWTAALVALAMVSISLLLVFAVTASVTLLGGSWLLFRKTQGEEK